MPPDFPTRPPAATEPRRARTVVDEHADAWRDPAPGVWIAPPDLDRLVREADALDALDEATRATLPLLGRTVAIKGNIDVAGLATTAGCPAFAYDAPGDAEVVARLRAAGALVVGTTNLDQFATGLTGTRSPYGVATNALDPALVPGGSSSGSAVAVATGLVDAALGTDTAGSGRVPAACNGVVGWKPAPGRWPMRGVVPACRSLDCVSVFARDVTTASVFAATLDPDPVIGHDGPITIAVADAATVASWAPATAAAYADHVADLAAAGHDVVVVDVGAWFEIGALLYDGPWVAERMAAVGDFIAAHPDAVVPVVRDIILGGRTLLARDAFVGIERLEHLAATTATWWAAADVLLLPTVDEIPTVAEALADPLGTSRRLGRLTNAANLLRLAAISWPAGRRADGRPFGVTGFAPPARATVLQALAGVPTTSPTGLGPYDLAVVGAHLTGLPLNARLTERGGRHLATTTTSDRYRFHRLAGGPPLRPGLERVASGGAPIEVEVWRLDAAGFAAVVAEIPPPLGIGAVELADGRWVRGFVCEPIGIADATDITASGGWRAHLAATAGGV